MSTFKRAKVVMLPTNKPSKLGDLATYQGKSLAKVIKEGVNLKNTTVQFWNLYIISDDKIKVGAWVINKWNEIHQITKNDGEEYIKTCKKIITTTDTSLKIDNPNYDIGRLAYINLPQPSQQFIEKFIEEYNRGNVITDVLIEYELISNEEYFGNTVNPDNDVPYFDEKLKINPKDNTITIKKVKDSWNREEMINKLYLMSEFMKNKTSLTESSFNKWIKENL
jgi:hypothetical protein